MLCLYHADCVDGFCAAYICKLVNPNFSLIPVKYGEPPPDVTDSEVIIVDFSYPRETLIKMRQACCKNSFVVLDHHKTAEENCKDLDFCQFDMSKSGAMLTWEYFYPYKNIPQLVRYVQDHDLWQHKLPFTKEINAAIRSYDYTFDDYKNLHKMLEDEQTQLTIMAEGAAILRYQEKSIQEHIKRACVSQAGIFEVNISDPSIISETLHRLSVGRPYAISYYANEKSQHIYSLRSDKNGVDVSEVAKQFGGGGHKHAAGYTL